MNIIYKDVDITDDVEVKDADIHDNAGGKADSITLVFADPEGLWSRWKPQKGDEIIVIEDGFTSGKMFVDEKIQKPGIFILRGISTPLSSKSNNTRSWENIRFKKIVQDVSSNIGLGLKTYNIRDWLYDRVNQINETDLEFLKRLCIREGYALKVTDGNVVIYDERVQEQDLSVTTIYEQDLIGDFEFADISNGLKSACIIRYIDNLGEVIEYEFKDKLVYGDVLKINERVSSQGEAERFAKGYLRSINKFEKTGNINIKLNPKIAAGNMIEISEVGMADGEYFVDQVIQRLTRGRSIVKLRKPLEGY